MRHYAFVGYDAKTGVLGPPIAKDLMEHGAEITVFSDGPSRGRWEEAGFQIMSINEVAQVFSHNDQPKALIAGLSSRKLGGAEFEMKAVEEARKHNVPVISLADDWGAECRRDDESELYLALDRLGEQLIKQRFPNAQVTIMGDDAICFMPSRGVSMAVDRLKATGKTVVLYYGNKDPRTATALEVALDSLRKSPNTVLVPKLHPGAQPEFIEWCNEQIERIKEEFPDRIADIPGHSDQIAALADITIGIGGTGFRVACHNGKTPILVWSPEIAEMLKEETGGPRHPLVQGAVVLEIIESRSFGDFINVDRIIRGPLRRQEFFAHPTYFSGAHAAAEILKFVG